MSRSVPNWVQKSEKGEEKNALYNWEKYLNLVNINKSFLDYGHHLELSSDLGVIGSKDNPSGKGECNEENEGTEEKLD